MNKNVNVRTALIHAISDALQNICLLIEEIIIYFKPYYHYCDPICNDTDLNEIENDLKNINGVYIVHDLHVWSLSLEKISMRCHLIGENE